MLTAAAGLPIPTSSPAASTIHPNHHNLIKERQSDCVVERGLSSSEASALLSTHGPNSTITLHLTPSYLGIGEESKPDESLLNALIGQIREDRLAHVLLGAACISVLASSTQSVALPGTAEVLVEPGIILAILVANGLVGAVQERNSRDALKQVAVLCPQAPVHVRRDSQWQSISRDLLVPGDLLSISRTWEL